VKNFLKKVGIQKIDTLEAEIFEFKTEGSDSGSRFWFSF